MPATNVLLVEDHTQLRRVLCVVLESAGFAVTVAGSADDAMKLLERGQPFDILFSDIRMPGRMNGLDLARWIRRHYPACRILLQTGFTSGDTEDFAILRKPYSDLQLTAALESLKPPAKEIE
jgi:two-component system, NtrC family, sensor kinase